MGKRKGHLDIGTLLSLPHTPAAMPSSILITSSNDCTLKQQAKRNLLVALLEYFYHCGEKNNTVISVF